MPFFAVINEKQTLPNCLTVMYFFPRFCLIAYIINSLGRNCFLVQKKARKRRQKKAKEGHKKRLKVAGFL